MSTNTQLYQNDQDDSCRKLAEHLWSLAAASPFRAVGQLDNGLPNMTPEQRSQLVALLRHLATMVEIADESVVGLHLCVASTTSDNGGQMVGHQEVLLMDQFALAAMFLGLEPHGQQALDETLKNVMSAMHQPPADSATVN